MHDPSAEGNDFFKCDFCRHGWSQDRPMVEGHKGSLICAPCLTLAFDELWNRPGGQRVPFTCTLCLEHREEPYWVSPAFPEAGICKRCTKQSVVMLERDPEAGWKRPPGPGP